MNIQRSQKRLGVEKLEHRRMLTAVCSSGRDGFTVGLTSCSEQAYDGYTLLAPDMNSSAFLLDVHGRIVNEWTDAPYPGRRGANIGPDGSLYSSGTISNPAQGAGGVTGALYIQDWDGNVTWDFNFSDATQTLHHDIEVLPNGNVLAFAWKLHTPAEVIALGRDPSAVPAGGLWGERVVELAPTGLNTADIVWEWNWIDHLVQDFDATKPNFGVVGDNPQRFDINVGAQGGNPDWIHVNAIDYNPVLDQVMINSPFTGELYIIDHSTTTAEAATSAGGNSGKGGDFLYRWGNPTNYDAPGARQLFNQHDAKWIDTGRPGEGNILVFNNQDTPNSTVVELQPPTIDAMGNYELIPGMAYGPSSPLTVLDTGVNANFISGSDRLPNGNTLFVNGPQGVIGELTPDGDQVWEYSNPLLFTSNAVQQGANPPGNNIFKSRRYEPGFSGFVGRDLSPKGYVEDWVIGDYDLDRDVDALDFDQMCGDLASGDRIYDVNLDDDLNELDVEAIVTGELGFLMGDANFDGFVDGSDFIDWNNNRFEAGAGWSGGDFNCDGVTDAQDFIIWNENKFTAALIAPSTDSRTFAAEGQRTALDIHPSSPWMTSQNLGAYRYRSLASSDAPQRIRDVEALDTNSTAF